MKITFMPNNNRIENVLKWAYKPLTRVLYVLHKAGKDHVEAWYKFEDLYEMNAMKDNITIWAHGVEKTSHRNVEPGPMGGFCPK